MSKQPPSKTDQTIANGSKQVDLSLTTPDYMSGRIYLTVHLSEQKDLSEVFFTQVKAGSTENIHLKLPANLDKVFVTFLSIDRESNRTITHCEEIWLDLLPPRA